MSRRSINNKIVFVHPSATVDPGARIGKGTLIWHYCHVMKGAQIGQNCIIGQNVYLGRAAVVGNGVKIQNNVSIYDKVTLEDDVFCGPSMVFTNVINPRAFIERKDEFMPTLVKKGATLGANCTILCGTTIGAYAMVGAGAVITRDVPDYGLVVGVPAQQVGWVCRCGVTLDPPAEGEAKDAPKDGAQMICLACEERYLLEDDALRPEDA